MNKIDYKNLTPFKWFVLENFPFIEADFDALTEWQLFCKIGKEINKIIDSQNIVGEQAENLTNALNNLKNYVDNYFDNLDEEIGRVNTVINLLEEEITKVEKYSTNEQKIGKWIDGKPLYRKVTTVTTSTAFYYNTWVELNTINVKSVSQIIECKYFNNEMGYTMPLIAYRSSSGVLNVMNLRNTTIEASKFEILLEYTKTTD